MKGEFAQRMRETRGWFEEHLCHILEGRGTSPPLKQAMEYSLLAGGKRIRPLITLEVCRMLGGELSKALPLACGLEMIHTYSLIHDDLPEMDNDDLRRGRPTNHKVFGGAMAILAGDALLTEAFHQIALGDLPPEALVDGVRCLAWAAGMDGMVGGQALDIEGKERDQAQLRHIHQLKTGALLVAAGELGCIAAGGTAAQREAVRCYTTSVGEAFQIQDDILDQIGNQKLLGKKVGSDQANHKETFVTCIGLEASQKMVLELTEQGVRALHSIPGHEFLVWLARDLAQRGY